MNVNWYTGKLVLVEKLDNETLEKQCMRICKEINLDKDKLEYYGYDSFEDMLINATYGYNDGYIIYNNRLYKFNNVKNKCENLLIAKENEDKSINFEIRHDGDNASYGFNDIVIEALKQNNIK